MIIQAHRDITRFLATHALGQRYEGIPPDVVRIAKHCFLDWIAVTLVGSREPLVAMLLAQIEDEGGRGAATIIGSGKQASARQAGLVNGAASHALDFDDVHLGSRVHPSAAVFPAALAAGQAHGASGMALITAFVAGVETQCRIAAAMGEGHYRRGWHNTATLGTFGATMAAALIEGLSIDQGCQALGIAATLASGLRASFGTMCKPLHAGHAAANALLAVGLAKRGFTGRADALECAQGFAAIMGDGAELEQALAKPERYYTRTIIFKHHASCYGTHAPIEAALRLRDTVQAAPDAIKAVEVEVEPQYLSVCNIGEPKTETEAKFSIAHAVALALSGRSTVAAESFSPAVIADERVASLRAKIVVRATKSMPRAHAEVCLRLADGTARVQPLDASRPQTDLDAQQARIGSKFCSIVQPLLGTVAAEKLMALCVNLDEQDDLQAVLTACRIERGAPARS